MYVPLSLVNVRKEMSERSPLREMLFLGHLEGGIPGIILVNALARYLRIPLSGVRMSAQWVS